MQAEALYRKAIAARPDFAGAHSNLGNLLKEQMRFDEALEEFHVTAAAPPSFRESSPGSQLTCVVIQCCTTTLQAALKANPTFAEAYSNLGNAYKELQRYTEAIDSYNQVGIAAPRAEVSIPLSLSHTQHTTRHRLSSLTQSLQMPTATWRPRTRTLASSIPPLRCT